jgi:hypothetical protein
MVLLSVDNNKRSHLAGLENRSLLESTPGTAHCDLTALLYHLLFLATTSTSAAVAAGGDRGLIPGKEELQEQYQVTPVHDKRRRVVVGGNAAGGLGLVQVKTEHGQRDADDHLGYLQDRDEDWFEPAGTALDGHQAVVPVHDSVDKVVHHHKENTTAAFGHVRVPTIQQDRHVMVPMQKDERLFVYHNKEGIEQFGEFGQDKELDP